MKRIAWKKLAIELKDAYQAREMQDEKWLLRLSKALGAVERAQKRKLDETTTDRRRNAR